MVSNTTVPPDTPPPLGEPGRGRGGWGMGVASLRGCMPMGVQLMYTSHDPAAHHATYFALMRDLVQAAPSAWSHVTAVSNHIMAGEMYKALKSAKALIAYEQELLDHATRSVNLRRDRQKDSQSA